MRNLSNLDKILTWRCVNVYFSLKRLIGKLRQGCAEGRGENSLTGYVLTDNFATSTRAPAHAPVMEFQKDARKRRDRPQCGARTRSGHSCQMRVEQGKNRCRLHGGLSTGPRTPEGKARIAEALRRRWQSWREQ